MKCLTERSGPFPVRTLLWCQAQLQSNQITSVNQITAINRIESVHRITADSKLITESYLLLWLHLNSCDCFAQVCKIHIRSSIMCYSCWLPWLKRNSFTLEIFLYYFLSVDISSARETPLALTYTIEAAHNCTLVLQL